MCFSPCQSERRTAWLDATWTEWKNLFSLEIYGRNGKLEIHRLGGSYGVESLTFYHMLPRWGPPETTRWEKTSPRRCSFVGPAPRAYRLKAGNA